MTAIDWAKKIDTALLHLDEKPQFGLTSDFPIEALEELLGRLFDRPNIKASHTEKGWQEGLQLFEGLGEKLSVLAIEWTPLETPLYFILGELDLKELMGELLGGEEAATPFFDASLSEGFFHYLALEILQLLEALRFMAPLSPRIKEAPLDIKLELEKTACFVSDISLILHDKTVWGRLLVPEDFRKALKKNIANLPSMEMSEGQARKIPVELILEVGKSHLSLQEWKEVKLGDFILLDRCSYDPHEKKGSLILRLGEEPIFRGRFKEEGIKLSEYPLYEEVNNKMEENEEIPDFLGETEKEPLEGSFVSHKESDFDSLPVNLTVEVGRIRMSIKELKDLSPGNVIEMNVTPEEGVDLVVNGKKVGRGELIRMGEALGVRILSF